MDWIKIAIGKINFQAEHYDSTDTDAIFSVLSLIMRVAMIKEGVEQIHRVLYNTTEIYLSKDSTAFQNKISEAVNQTDNEYFETLRACFGVHPMNLDSLHKDDKRTKLFASRPTAWFGRFEVMLCSNQVHGDFLEIPIPFGDLCVYAKRRYDHLGDLTERMSMIMRDNMPLP